MPDFTIYPGDIISRPLLNGLAKNWWLILLRGICAVIFGVLTYFWPAVTLFTLIILYGIFALADGVLALFAAITGDGPDGASSRWWLAAVGLLGIAAGIITLLWPGMTGLILLFFIAAWSIATGFMQIFGAIKLRKEIEGEWLLIASGVLSVLFGVAIAAWPGAGALALAFVIGAFAILYGVLLIAFAFKLRKFAQTTS
jgi:uncharacterized membrane protein HdeD (DUF308 family)